jgi:hypothetical protein
MAFPDINKYVERQPCPYEREMGLQIAGLLRLFVGRVPDVESNERVLELVATPGRWSAGHAVFDEVRRRLLVASRKYTFSAVFDKLRRRLVVATHKNAFSRVAQYSFEESCCQAVYNASSPPDEFDPSSPFFVAGKAFALARLVGVPSESVISALAPEI